MMERNMKFLSQRGFSLLEVVIAIAIFAIGMLGLASLQGSLTRSSADANLRMVATNIAERTIEELRAFGRIDADPLDPMPAYADIKNMSAEPIEDGGISFSRVVEVIPYYYVLADDGFSITPPEGVVYSDFKLVEVTVSWGAIVGDNAGFQLEESQDALSSSDLGSGEITLSTIMSSITTLGSARVSTQGEDKAFAALVSYDKADNKEIIALKLGEGKLKESLTPEPDVTLDEYLIETRFDVITYSQNGLFLRREEFAVVSCECTLQAEDGDSRRPVIWAGDEYVRGQTVQKSYGLSANNQQSPLCVSCCRDHHDGGSDALSSIKDHSTDAAVNVYDPFNKPSDGSDHEHYARTNAGLDSVTSGEDYVEACRLVRQDGFFRVAQDFRREDLNVFPADFLDDSGLIDLYSSYATGAVSSYATAAGSPQYPINPNNICIGPSPCAVESAPKQSPYDFAIDTDGLGNPTQLPSWTTLPISVVVGAGVDNSICTDLGLELDEPCQQLTSRGIYIDYLSADLRTVLTNCVGDDITADSDLCKSGDVDLDRTGSVNPLEMIPFFDVQMTRLNRWNEAPANNPVETFNESLESGGGHDRGIIYKVADGESTVVANGHRGNLGFTDSFPIDTEYYSQVTSSSIFVHAGSATTLPEGTAILGSLAHSVNGNIEIIMEGLNGVECGQTTVDYGCTVSPSASNPQIMISGYGKNGKVRYACSTGTSLNWLSGSANDEFANAVFDVNVVAGTTYNFIIQEDVPCS